MSDEGLRAALEACLSTLPQMVHLGNDYPTQALPKAELLDLLAMNPPSRICGNTLQSFGVELLCRKPIGHDGAHQNSQGTSWTLLSHLTDDGAGSGEPAVAAGEAGSIPAGNPAPSSPHLEALRGRLDQLWGWAKSGKQRDPHDPTVEYYLMDTENVDAFTRHVLDLFGEGATPAIDREALTELLRFNRHAPYVSNERLADMVTALIEGAS